MLFLGEKRERYKKFREKIFFDFGFLCVCMCVIMVLIGIMLDYCELNLYLGMKFYIFLSDWFGSKFDFDFVF